MIGGLQGDLGLGDWTWEAYFSHGNTIAENSVHRLSRRPSSTARSSRLRTSAATTPSPTYLNSKSVSCTSGLPIFEQFAVSQDCIDAILTDSSDRSSMTQNIYEANLQGGIVDLPAGELRRHRRR